MSSDAIETRGLSRVYKSYRKPEGVWNSLKGLWDRQTVEKTALQPTTLRIAPGQIVGLVGANGAGKTTLLKLLSGLITPSHGDALVLGHHPWKRESAFLKRVSILLGQKNQLWWDLAPLDSFALLARIYDLDLAATRRRVRELTKRLQCDHVVETQLRRLSLGERMKMEIIGALLHSPDVLFLDEPTIGLDIVAQESIRDFLAGYVRSRGPTVILTSHYMDDIAQLAHSLLLISKGAIVYEGTVQDFTRKTESVQTLSVRFAEDLAADVRLDGDLHLAKGGKEFHLKIPADRLGPVIAELSRHGSIQDLKTEETDFEDVIKSFLATESRLL
ncbi:MAG: ATP-binding cassette domain-containing protein [Bdellovibrionaceae bacterium]|nr:ATP-binding cassette domain-containing protein [Pseudobdellovibrionaceae bacterium]